MLDLTVYAVPVFIVGMIAESLLLRRLAAQPETAVTHVVGYTARDTAASLAMGIGNVVIDLVVKGIHLALLGFVHRGAMLQLDASSPWVWAAAFVAVDFVYYWFHRLHHEVRFLWAAHVNHHSSRHYNLSTALRQSWTTPFTGMLFYWPLALVGFAPLTILACSALNTLYQFWIHTEAIDRLGPLEWFLNTPSHHRVHHGSNVGYLDRNHGGVLIVWDRLFGTFVPESEPVRYGLTKNIETYNPLRIAAHEWLAMLGDARRAAPLSVRLGYLVQPPGWSPDGSTQTSDQMRGTEVAA